MESFDEVELSSDGQTARIGGGTLSKKITDTLWAKGKQTVTGVCECTSLVGPLLGGGHGWLQGRNGLAVDQLLEARVVLPSGELVTVTKDSAYSDLFWVCRAPVTILASRRRSSIRCMTWLRTAEGIGHTQTSYSRRTSSRRSSSWLIRSPTKAGATSRTWTSSGSSAYQRSMPTSPSSASTWSTKAPPNRHRSTSTCTPP